MCSKFKATIKIIGINPFVFLPKDVLENIFLQANKSKGAIPVKGSIDGHPYIQNLVRFKGEWRLYINGIMRKAAKKDVGQEISISIEYDPEERIVEMHPKLKLALEENPSANQVFDGLNASTKKEIKRYIIQLKSENAIDRNVERAIQFLLGNGSFIGRRQL